MLDHLYAVARHGDAMAHWVRADGGAGDGAPLLGDQAAVAAALLDAYELTGERRWLRRARSLARWTCEHLCAPDGRLLDRLALPGESAGLLAQPVPALDENAAMAEVLLRLEAYTGEARLRERALEILAAWATHYEQYGVAASAYAQALLRYLERPAHIVVVGRRDDDEARRLHAAALVAPSPLRTVQWLDPSDGSRRRSGSPAAGLPSRARRGGLRLPRPHLLAVPALSGNPACGGISCTTLSAHVRGGTMITLYQSEWCFYSHRVRQVLTELGLTFTAVNVPAAREDRAELLAIAGQDSAPVLVDGDKVYGESDEIIEYLRATYPAPEDADEHAAMGAWRAATMVSLAPRAALARLRELLEEKGFMILAQIKGPKINERLPKEYVILQVTVPVAAVKTLSVDPLAPAAIMFPIAVIPTEDGKSVVASADPVGQVWLYGELELRNVQAAVKKRLGELFEEL